MITTVGAWSAAMPVDSGWARYTVMAVTSNVLIKSWQEDESEPTANWDNTIMLNDEQATAFRAAIVSALYTALEPFMKGK